MTTISPLRPGPAAVGVRRPNRLTGRGGGCGPPTRRPRGAGRPAPAAQAARPLVVAVRHRAGAGRDQASHHGGPRRRGAARLVRQRHRHRAGREAPGLPQPHRTPQGPLRPGRRPGPGRRLRRRSSVRRVAGPRPTGLTRGLPGPCQPRAQPREARPAAQTAGRTRRSSTSTGSTRSSLAPSGCFEGGAQNEEGQQLRDAQQRAQDQNQQNQDQQNQQNQGQQQNQPSEDKQQQLDDKTQNLEQRQQGDEQNGAVTRPPVDKPW